MEILGISFGLEVSRKNYWDKKDAMNGDMEISG